MEYGPVVQLDRTERYGRFGWGFESLRVLHERKKMDWLKDKSNVLTLGIFLWRTIMLSWNQHTTDQEILGSTPSKRTKMRLL